MPIKTTFGKFEHFLGLINVSMPSKILLNTEGPVVSDKVSSTYAELKYSYS